MSLAFSVDPGTAVTVVWRSGARHSMRVIDEITRNATEAKTPKVIGKRVPIPLNQTLSINQRYGTASRTHRIPL